MLTHWKETYDQPRQHIKKQRHTSTHMHIHINLHTNRSLSSLVAQMVKRLPAMRETWAQSLGQEDPSEKEVVTHSSTLA